MKGLLWDIACYIYHTSTHIPRMAIGIMPNLPLILDVVEYDIGLSCIDSSVHWQFCTWDWRLWESFQSTMLSALICSEPDSLFIAPMTTHHSQFLTSSVSTAHTKILIWDMQIGLRKIVHQLCAGDIPDQENMTPSFLLMKGLRQTSLAEQELGRYPQNILTQEIHGIRRGTNVLPGQEISSQPHILSSVLCGCTSRWHENLIYFQEASMASFW